MGSPATAPKPGQVVVLRVSVRAPDLETFIARYSKHLDGDRIFIFTKSPQPVGTRVRFTLLLQTGEQLIHGKGTVTRVQEETADRRYPSGMELVFVALDDRSQTLVDFMLASREGDPPPIVRAVKDAPKPPPPPDAALQPPADEPTAAESPAEEAPAAAPAMAPAMAEKWNEPLAPGPPAASPESSVPANPFSEISDNAIEYFVEWSLERSTAGSSTERTSQFSNVPMALAEKEPEAVAAAGSRRPLFLVGGGAFAVGLLLGGLVVGLVISRPLPPKPVEAVAKPVEPPPPPPPPQEGALSVITRPAGAILIVDGKAAGTTPATLKLTTGEHHLTVSKDRYQSLTTSAQVPVELDLELKRPQAKLVLTSTPSGAEVSVSGSVRGKTPLTLELPQYERYEIVVRGAGKPWKKTVYLRAAQNSVGAKLGR